MKKQNTKTPKVKKEKPLKVHGTFEQLAKVMVSSKLKKG